jgi:signal transduction histidine kinase
VVGDLYLFLFVAVVAIVLTGVALVYSNRAIFRHLAKLSEQKSVLTRKLISLQEEVLRSVSRELHDEFGQILTAIGAMLSRLGRKHVPAESPLAADLAEIRDMTQSALDKVRSLSQMLHPAVIDDYGLEKAIEWYVPMFEKQTGIPVDYKKTGTGPAIKDETAIHVYRILQEALNNVARHSGSKRAAVRVHYEPDHLRLEVEDRGKGIPSNPPPGRNGLGLVAMRERAELVHGKLKLQGVPQGGTLVWLEVPISHDS